MKIAPIALTCMLTFTACAWADWDPIMPKWLPEAPPDAWGQVSHYRTSGMEQFDYITSDDFLCDHDSYIAEIHFKGWDQLSLPPNPPRISNFRVRIWADVPATPGVDESHPQGDVNGGWLWEKTFYKAVDTDPHKIGWQWLGTDPWGLESYVINIAQPDWFHQLGTQNDPIIYWISIQGGGGNSIFFWSFKDREALSRLDDAAFLSKYGTSEVEANVWYNNGCPPTGDPQEPWGDPTTFRDDLPDGWKSIDMYFSLYDAIPEPATAALIGVGGLLMLRRRTTA